MSPEIIPEPAWLQLLERELGALPVLLVEGSDDVAFYEYFLEQYNPAWSDRFEVKAAGGKQHVVQAVIHHRPAWAGIVDLDEGVPRDLEADVRACARLRLLPRFCVESYYCDPAELWSALPARQRETLGDDSSPLSEPVYVALADWVAHGAMWRVLRELYRRTRLPGKLEEEPVTDEAKIRHILEEWHRQLSPDTVLEQYHHELGVARALARDEQIHRYVHGKKFFNQVVVQRLDHLFAGQGAGDWIDRFRSAGIQPPPDLVEVLDWAMAQFLNAGAPAPEAEEVPVG